MRENSLRACPGGSREDGLLGRLGDLLRNDVPYLTECVALTDRYMTSLSRIQNLLESRETRMCGLYIIDLDQGHRK
jgi:hypothetical protein